MNITVTELETNLDKYLILSETKDIFITKNEKEVAKLSNPNQDRLNIAKSLFGAIPSDYTLEETKEKRLHDI